jgi:hypothetical protein
VTNGSFETDSFSGWTVGGNSGASTFGPQMFIDTTPENGAYAAALGSMGSDGTLSQTIATTAGSTYTLSFWLKKEGSDPNDFKATWNGQTLLSLANATQSGYTQYTYTMTATGAASTLQFSARNDPSQWDLDNISLTASGTSSAPPPAAAPIGSTAAMTAGLMGAPLVTNGSFETDSFSGWTLGGNSGVSTYGPQLFIDTTPENGPYAAALGSMGSDGTLSQTIATTAGKTYTLSFWLKNEESGTNDFKATWNGQTLLSLANAAQSGYTQYTYTVPATGAVSTLQFFARNDPSQWDLDNISLTLPSLTSETVAITGTAAEGQTLTAKVTDNDPNATSSYQWQYESGSAWRSIAGATASTFTVGVPQEGETLRVVATGVDGATTLSATSSATTAVKAAVPVLTIANNSLSVTAGGAVALGVSVTVPEAGDTVNVGIAGLPSYETITDALDGKTFAGSAVALTAAEVNSGLTLFSSYTGTGHPVAPLALTATNGTGAATMTTASQTLTVTDPPSQASASGALDSQKSFLDSDTMLSHWDHDTGMSAGFTTSDSLYATSLGLLMQHAAGGFDNLGDYRTGGAIAANLGSAGSFAAYSSPTAAGLSHA